MEAVKGRKTMKTLGLLVTLTLLASMLAACGPTPEPEVIRETVVVTKEVEVEVEKIVTQVVVETVIVEGTPEIVEKVVTVTPEPTPVPITEPQSGGTLRIATLDDFTSFDPHDISWSGFPMRAQLYDSILRYRHNLDPLPGLAESWELSDNGLQVTLHLRKGVKFHNGRELVAEDVVKNLDKARDPATCRHMCSGGLRIGSYEALDDYTVVLHYDQLYTAWADWLEDFYVIAPESFDQLNEAPIGTGPFKFKEYIPNDHATFVKNEDYWGPEGPYLDEIVYRPFGGDDQAMAAALETGAVDMLHDTPWASVERLREKGFVLYEGEPGALVNVLYIDPLNITDKRVRCAINYAFDRQLAIEATFFGIGEPYWSPYPRESWAYNTEMDKYHSDLEKARELVQEAGAEGLTLTFSAYQLDQVRTATILQAGLKEIGINLVIEMTDVDTWVDRFVRYDYDVMDSYISGSNKDPASYYNDNYMFKIAPASNMITPDKYWPVHPVTGEAYGDLVVEGGATLDQARRKEIYDTIQEILANECWANAWTRRASLFTLAPYVRGFEWKMDDGILLENVWLAR